MVEGRESREFALEQLQTHCPCFTPDRYAAELDDALALVAGAR
jgi:hypothetical protein